MTPAVKLLQKNKVGFDLHEYEHESSERHFGEEAVSKLGVSGKRFFKTLLVTLDCNPRKMAVAVTPVPAQLDLKKVAAAFNVKKAEMADPDAAARVTGYLVGGISPLAQKRALPTVIDKQAHAFETIFISGGKRGLSIEMTAEDLGKLTSAIFAHVARDD